MKVMQTSAINFTSRGSRERLSGSNAVIMLSANIKAFGAEFPTVRKRQAKRQPARYFGLVYDSCSLIGVNWLEKLDTLGNRIERVHR